MTRPAGLFCLAAALAVAACGPGRPRDVLDRSVDRRIRSPRAAMRVRAPASLGELHSALLAASARAETRPDDEAAGLEVTEALLRLARVTGSSAFAVRAERTVRRLLDRNADHALGRRELAAALVAQHRFQEALDEAERSRAIQPRDPAPLGVIADAALELGDYTRAFAAVETMLQLRPDAGAYARAAHVRRLHGDDDGAVRSLEMAIDATGGADAETLAWLHAELGIVLADTGRMRAARRELERARYIFPGHPTATRHLARLATAAGRSDAALRLIEEAMRAAPSPADHALASIVLSQTGKDDDAASHARLAEAGWRSDAPDPVQLTHFLVDRGRPQEAVEMATLAAAERQDIFTLDALGWAYYRAGRPDDAAEVYGRIAATGLRPRALHERARIVAKVNARTGGRR